MQQAEPPSARRLAYHEAGHAVVGQMLGATMRYVTIKPTVVYGAGHTFGLTHWRDLDQGSADRLVLVGLAGSAAEERAMNDADEYARSDERDRIEQLLVTAQLLGKRAGPPTITAEEEARVAEILEQYWPVVEALAAVLEKKRTLSGRRVAKIISRSLLSRTTRAGQLWSSFFEKVAKTFR
jgi:ATP-dependent Zn protease